LDTVQFLDIVLPSAGRRCVAIPATTREGKAYYKQFFGDTNGWLAEAAQHLDANRGHNVYYGLGGYGDEDSRKQSNVVAVRSFWLDLDVGANDPKKYPTQRAAAEAVLAFAAKLGLATPFLVNSGGGVHCYWPMVEDIDPAVWLPTAQFLKAACRAEGVKADPSRTADHASVLRPPGTHHRKAEPKPVRLVVEGHLSDLNAFQQALLPYAMQVEMAGDDPLGPPPAHLTPNTNSDLTGGIEFRPSSSARAAEKCGVMALVRDSQGNVDQPTWYYTLGVMAFTTDGHELAHEWSAGHPDYSRGETDQKLQQAAKVGHPTTCAKLADYQPTICAACPFNGQVKTPYSLGTYDPNSVQIETEKVVRTEGGGFRTIPAKVEMPDGFDVHHDNTGREMLMHAVFDEESQNWAHEPFCETVFWPVSRLWIEGVAHVECEMKLKAGAKRRFIVEGGTIGKGKDSLAAELARNEIVPLNNKGFIMDSYMKRWLTHLKENAEQHVAYRHFGWTAERAFALGDTVFHPGGGETRSILVGMAKSKGYALEPKGSLDTWIDVVDRAYNAPGQEAFQFLVACGFAAPLLSMMNQVNGVTVYAHSEGSGVGKTTAQRVALSAWGNWDQLMIADGKVTQNAMWGLMGAYHSLPIVFDELTNQRNDVASELVFSVSSGRSKERMNASGELRENNSNWCTILLASGNNLLSEKLALHRGNAEAEMSRLFEFTLRAQPHLSPNDANALFPKLLNNYGHAGRVFIKYVVDNYDAIEHRLLKTQAALNDELGITQVERYWSALLAATLVSGAICRTLGLLRFELSMLKNWLIERLAENRVQRNDAANDPLELFGSMLADLWQGILVTNGEGDMRKGVVAAVVEKPRGALVGRAILPDGKNAQSVLMLNHQAVRDWANKKGVSAREMFRAVVDAGWADPNHARYSLGRGTVEYAHTSSYIACWQVYPEKITGSEAGKLVSQKLGSVQGGKDASANAAR
jgi:hypothetical protein